METNAPNILELALALPDSDRADLAFHLISSLPAPGISVEDPQFLEKIERRITAFESGTTEACSVEEVEQRVRAALKSRRNP
jgi:putative addiction module component (TIGR02574 family)